MPAIFRLVVASDGITQSGFVSLGGTITQFAIPDATATLGYQINASNQSVGYTSMPTELPCMVICAPAMAR
jgi:hypothetical protein